MEFPVLSLNKDIENGCAIRHLFIAHGNFQKQVKTRFRSGHPTGELVHCVGLLAIVVQSIIIGISSLTSPNRFPVKRYEITDSISISASIKMKYDQLF